MSRGKKNAEWFIIHWTLRHPLKPCMATPYPQLPPQTLSPPLWSQLRVGKPPGVQCGCCLGKVARWEWTGAHRVRAPTTELFPRESQPLRGSPEESWHSWQVRRGWRRGECTYYYCLSGARGARGAETETSAWLDVLYPNASNGSCLGQRRLEARGEPCRA